MAGAATPWALNLAAIGEAAAQGTVADYKALVCVFLYGGNDYGNTLVPYDTLNYNAYQTIRSSIALPQASLANTVLAPDIALPNARQMAFAPELTPMKALFDQGTLGVLLNVGTLIAPTTLAQYNAKSVPLPPKLFSHNDQQSFWQSSSPEGATSGWGGRLGDLMLSGNGKSTFTCVSVTGNAVYLAGHTAVQYQVSTGGSIALKATNSKIYGSQAVSDALRSLSTVPYANALANEYVRVMNRSIDANAVLNGALAGQTPLQTVFDPTNPLAMQLQMVARMIAVRNVVGARRQVFFVSLGGFDNHDFLPTQHPKLLSQLGSAMSSFYSATAELGVASNVTSFTGSDFGRTLSSNGDGSDHGWGSHHVVMGGAVRGRSFWGTLPATAVNGPDDVGQGRLLPTTSVDQLGAELALWFGVSPADLPTVLPNAGNFNLGGLRIFG
ncbi:MAG: DUF1501 domain-containing protein [Burkholderiaceae bacterium]